MSAAKKKAPAKAKPGKYVAKTPALRADQIVKRLAIPATFEIKTPADYVAACERLKSMKGAIKEIRADLKSVVDPIMVGVNRLKAIAARSLDQLASDEEIHKSKIAAYDDRQRTLQAAEQRRLDEAADRKRAKITAEIENAEMTARNEAKQLRRDASVAHKAGDKVKAAALREQAKATEAKLDAKIEKLTDKAANVVAPIIQREAPKVAGISFRHNNDFEVIDPSKINRPFLSPDLEKIRAHVRALGPDAQSAIGEGVRIYLNKGVASTSEDA